MNQTTDSDYVFEYGGNAPAMIRAGHPATKFDFIRAKTMYADPLESGAGNRFKYAATALRNAHNTSTLPRMAELFVELDKLMSKHNKRNREIPESVPFEERMSDPELVRIDEQGKAVGADYNKLREKSSELKDFYHSLISDLREEKAADSSIGSALKLRIPSYALSGLGFGALGRLISGKEHAGWGWGIGIPLGIGLNFLRRKSYYGDNARW